MNPSTLQHMTTSTCLIWASPITPHPREEEGYESVSEQNRLFSCCMHFRLCLRHSKIVCKAVWNPLVFVSSCRSQQVAVITKNLSGRVNLKKTGRKVPSNISNSTQLQTALGFESSLILQGCGPSKDKSYIQFLASSSPQLCKKVEVSSVDEGWSMGTCGCLPSTLLPAASCPSWTQQGEVLSK